VRPAACRPGTFQPVLQLAILEILEVERGGVLHEPKTGFVAEPLRQQSVEQRHGAAKYVGKDRKSEFQREQPADAVEQSARDPLPPFLKLVADRPALHARSIPAAGRAALLPSRRST